MLKVNNMNTRVGCEMCSKLTIKTPSLSFVAHESQYILQQPWSLKILVIWTYIYVLGCWYYNWTLFL